MRIFYNPFSMYEDYNDDSFIYEDAGVLMTIYVTLRIIGVNLLYGCILTVIYFKLRKLFSKIVSCFCCGECDCENEGYGRVIPARKGRKGGGGSRGCCDPGVRLQILSSIHPYVKHIPHGGNRRKLFTRVGVLIFGVIVSYQVVLYGAAGGKPVSNPIYSFSDPQVLQQGESKRVFFITPTAKSGVQIPRLIRLAQAVYPNRAHVTWVVISTDPVQVEPWSKSRWEHWSDQQIYEWKTNLTRVMRHLGELREVLGRFGVSYVLLSGHQIHHGGERFEMQEYRPFQEGPSAFSKGIQVGISWVVRTFRDGVFFIGIEDAAYNFNIFQEVRETNVMSVWPTAFEPRFILRLSSPFMGKTEREVRGYFAGGSVRPNEVPLYHSAYALSVRHGQKLLQSKTLGMLYSEISYSSTDINVTAEKVQCLSRNCSEIYVWKLRTIFIYARKINSQTIGLKMRWKRTNVPRIVEKINSWFAPNN